MKKKAEYLALVLLCALAVACGTEEPTQETPDEVRVQLADHERSLMVGDSVRLSYKLTGNSRVRWQSSNIDILSVDDRGIVRTLQTGNAYVVAQAGNSTDTCRIHVCTQLEMLRFKTAVLAGEPDTTYFHSGVLKGTMSGKTVYYYKALMTLYILSEGLIKTPEGTLSGSRHGALIKVQTPMRYGAERLNNGTKVFQIANTEYRLVDNFADTWSTIARGEIDETPYIGYMKRYLEARNQQDEDGAYDMLDQAVQCIHGATLSFVNYHSREEGFPDDGYAINDFPAAIITGGKFTLTVQAGNSVNYDLKNASFTAVPFAAGTENGIQVMQDASGKYKMADEQIHWGDIITY